MKKVLMILLALSAMTIPMVSSAQEEVEWMEYHNGLENDLIADGNVVVISFTTEWCNACETQRNNIDRLRQDNPDYNKLIYITVDFEAFEKQAIIRDNDVFGRSTILVLKSGGIIENVFADTSRSVMQELLDAGLAELSND